MSTVFPDPKDEPRSRFAYTEYSSEAKTIDARVTNAAKDMEAAIDAELPNGREKALALTKLEEAVMWVRKALRDV